MRLDLTHNKIVADTMTDRFRECLCSRLLPMLQTRLGEISELQMYEDYISDGFSFEGEWYYPMTAVTAVGISRVWVSWSVNEGDFEGGVPYAYVGEAVIDFRLHDVAPSDFEDRLRGRAYYCEEGLIPVRVESVAGSVFLSGKYSQTFIDEMARQLTPAIERVMGVSGLSGSCLSLSLVFAPETYMEHTSENVTYRRLLLADKTSAPRDLWVKWTGRGAVGYSVSDAVSADDISFELGEGVPQKIREKEYRFMLRVGPDKYRAAMGRKNITEWRELVKRALRRGELTKTEAKEIKAESIMCAAASEVPVMSAASVGEAAAASDVGEVVFTPKGENEPPLEAPAAAGLFDVAEPFEEVPHEEDDFAAEMRRACEAALGITDSAEPSCEEESTDDDEITRLALMALGLSGAGAAVDTEDKAEELVEQEAEEESFEEADEEVEELIVEDVEVTEVYVEEESSDEFDEEYVEEEICDEPDEEYVEEEICDEPDEEYVEEEIYDEPDEQIIETAVAEADCDALAEEEPIVAPVPDEESIRAEIEARVRLEYERRERERIEAEAERLRREQEALRRENERLLAEVRREREEWARREQARLAEAERLRAQIEQQLRAEEREKERLAEAARFAVEEKQRLAEEKLRAEERERENRLRMAKIEEERRIEAERLAEAERLRREAEERAEQEKQEVNSRYTYISKSVRLLFRRSVDPNVTSRIHEIIKATLEYYGKEKVHLRIKASVPDARTVCLDFVQIPMEEMELLSNIIKVLGNSGLGIAKAIVE